MNPTEVLKATSAGLWSIANECARSDLATAMRRRVEEYDEALIGVVELVEAARAVADDQTAEPAHDSPLARLDAALIPFQTEAR